MLAAPPYLMPVPVSELLAECDRLTATMQYDDDEGYHFWPVPKGDRIECGRCTNGARLIAEKFHGYVAGYPIDHKQPKALGLVAVDCGGHDFAVIGENIVDWWAWDYEQSLQSPVITIEEGIRRGLYRPKADWRIMSNFEIKHESHSEARTGRDEESPQPNPGV